MYLLPHVALCRGAAALAALFLFTACDDSNADSAIAADAGSGSDSEVDAGAGSGALNLCWLPGVPVDKCPVQPRGNLPADCPSGRVFESADFAPGTGPCVPSMPDWDCPAGWRPVPGFTDGSGNEDVPEGMTQFSICEPPEGSGWVGAPEGSGTVGASEGSGTVGAPEGSGTVGAPELPPTPTDCPGGTIAVPGDVACRPMGSPCPSAAERWASEADLRARAPGYDGPVVYVAADAAADGDGTRNAPQPLATAVASAAPGSLLALALGTYDASVAPDGIAVVGACVSGTVIAPTAENPDLGAIEIDGSRTVLISNLSVTGNHQGVVLRSASAGVSPQHSLRDVTIRRVLNRGLFVTARASVVAQSIRLEEVRPSPVDGSRGRGGQVDYGAVLVLRDAYVVNNFQAGLMAFNPDSVLDAENVLVAQTARQGSAEGVGRGIEVLSGSASTLRNVVLLGNHDIGLFADGSGTAVSATGLLIQDTQPDASDQTRGWGIGVQEGASLTLTGATLRNNHDAGLFAQGIGTTVEARGLLVEGTQPDASDQTWGRGVNVQRGASLSLSGATLRNNHATGLFADGVGTTVEASELLVEGTQPDASDQTWGRGISVLDGAVLSLTSAILRNNHDAGLFAQGIGATVEVRGLLVEGTQPDASDQTWGRGINVQQGASLSLTGATLRNNHDVGLFAYGVGTTVEARWLVIEDTQPQASDQTWGRGIALQDGAVLTLTGATLRKNHATGFFASGIGTAVRASRLLIEDTQPQASDQTWGWGIGVQEGAALTLEGAALRNNHDVGLLVGSKGTTVEARGLVIEETQPQASDQTFGRGIEVQDGASLALTGTTLRNNHDVGLVGYGAGTIVEATGLLVEGTRPQASDQTSGRGISVQAGAALSLTGATLRNNHDVGLFAYGVGTAVNIAGLLVAATQPQASDGRFGDGLLLQEGASLAGTNMPLWENARCGLQIAMGGVSVAVQGALIGRNLIGTNLQSSDFTRDDLAVGLRGETYLENGLDLGAASLPLPDPLEAIESLSPISP